MYFERRREWWCIRNYRTELDPINFIVKILLRNKQRSSTGSALNDAFSVSLLTAKPQSQIGNVNMNRWPLKIDHGLFSQNFFLRNLQMGRTRKVKYLTKENLKFCEYGQSKFREQELAKYNAQTHNKNAHPKWTCKRTLIKNEASSTNGSFTCESDFTFE